MDYFLISLGLVLIIVGLIGCIVPIIPGPPISFLGLLCLNYTQWGPVSSNLLWITATLAAVVTVLDYIVPIIGTKKFGGSKAGIWGATIGLFVGMFLGPIGIIFGPFAGAFLGEISQKKPTNDALKAALGSFIGLLLGVGFKLIVSGMITYYFIKEWIA